MTNVDDNLLGNSDPEPTSSGDISTSTEEVVTSTTDAAPLSVEAVPNASTTQVTPVTTSSPVVTAPAGIVVTNTATAQPTATNGNVPGLSYDDITDALLASIGDIGEKINFKMLIHGEPGSTKSSFLGSVPNCLIWDLEQGMISAKTAHIHTGRPMASGIQAVPYKSMMQGEAIVERLASHHPDFEKYEVFAIDTISSLHKRTLEDIMKREWRKRPSMNVNVPDTEHYTEVNEVLTRFIRSLADLDRDIIILCHSQTVEPKNKPAKTYPDFSEKLSNKLEAMMDIVGYMNMTPIPQEDGTKVIKPTIRVVSDGVTHAKTRIPLPEVILDPTYPAIKTEWEKWCVSQ